MSLRGVEGVAFNDKGQFLGPVESTLMSVAGQHLILQFEFPATHDMRVTHLAYNFLGVPRARELDGGPQSVRRGDTLVATLTVNFIWEDGRTETRPLIVRLLEAVNR